MFCYQFMQNMTCSQHHITIFMVVQVQNISAKFLGSACQCADCNWSTGTASRNLESSIALSLSTVFCSSFQLFLALCSYCYIFEFEWQASFTAGLWFRGSKKRLGCRRTTAAETLMPTMFYSQAQGNILGESCTTRTRSHCLTVSSCTCWLLTSEQKGQDDRRCRKVRESDPT